MSKGITGFSLYADYGTPIRDLCGFAALSDSNLTIRVVNDYGVIISDVSIILDISGSVVKVDLADGTLLTWIEEPSIINVSASKDCYSDGSATVAHLGASDSKLIEVVLSRPSCINDFTSDSYSFLRWRKAENLALPLDAIPELCSSVATCGQPRPQTLVFNPQIKGEYTGLVGVPGEYWNWHLNNDLQVTGNISLGLLKGSELIDGDVGTLTNQGSYILGTFDIPRLLDWGSDYRLIIWDTKYNAIFWVTDPFRISGDLYSTLRIKYRNTVAIDTIPYDLEPDFYNEFRIKATLKSSETGGAAKQYQSLSDRNTRFYAMDRKIEYGCKTLYFDWLAHQAAQSMAFHDEVYFNQVRYTPNPEYNAGLDLEAADYSHGDLKLFAINTGLVAY